MEQEIAILIADLSGYTALTEAHGAFSVADLVDKYIEITNAPWSATAVYSKPLE